MLCMANLCVADDWQLAVNKKLDFLVDQLNDGWSEEEKSKRKLVPIKNGDIQLYAGLLYIGGQHGGNGDAQYLAVYELGDGFQENGDDSHLKPSYSLVGLAIIGGRSERYVNFTSFKFEEGVFKFDAMAYENDAMCCPSKPVKLRYKLTFYGLVEL